MVDYYSGNVTINFFLYHGRYIVILLFYLIIFLLQ